MNSTKSKRENEMLLTTESKTAAAKEEENEASGTDHKSPMQASWYSMQQPLLT